VTFPDSEAYYGELLYDNVLVGDYEQLNPDPGTGNSASGDPLVHIRGDPGRRPRRRERRDEFPPYVLRPTSTAGSRCRRRLPPATFKQA